ncbi:hypothetical protein [Amycolatopsis sp. NPDC004625]|uniref:hypothetical protein n=1 Tax=Amycolatopsis sp. NPDC004625 TaxID=3154670 RepID=UPI0033A7F3E1
MTAWPGDLEHRALMDTAEGLISELVSLRRRLRHGNDVEYSQHGEFADRARGMGEQLRGAVMLARADLYAPAFGCLRMAFEHMLVDRLLFLGRRIIRYVENVEADVWEEWNRRRDNGDEEFLLVTEWSRTKKGRVEIVERGLRSTPSSGLESYELSPYYFLVKQFQPYMGTPSSQPMFDDGISDPARMREWAERNDRIYRTYLSWSSIKRNLQLNGFADEVTISRLDVHYRFLSAFVHPVSEVDSLIYGRNQINVPRYDHYSSELVLLYVTALALRELRHFVEMTGEAPMVEFIDGDVSEERWRKAAVDISYLWFPGDAPHEMDRVEEVNKRAFRQWRNVGSTRTVEDPSQIPDDGVRYYRDPLRRLVKMHSGFTEMTTGLSFVSPWPRADAPYR